MRFQFKSVHFIVDSKIVQAMMHKDSYGFKTYASVRVGEIQSSTVKESWAWTESENNIADWTTRVKSPAELDKGSEWQGGPKWLSLPENEWPIAYQPSNVEIPEILQVTIMQTDGLEEDDTTSTIDIT